jgi:(p)ppGpp synthase/HD superfamily hydrolase
MTTLNRAIAIAAEAHAGQLDKAGEPYIMHPLRVMMTPNLTADEMIVAVLHDVAEDCRKWPMSRLLEEGFSALIMGALAAITRHDGEEYRAYIDRVCTNDMAIVVKLADLNENMRDGRWRSMPESLRHRYSDAQFRIYESERGKRLRAIRWLP